MARWRIAKAAVTQWKSAVGWGLGELGSCAYIASSPGAFGVLWGLNLRELSRTHRGVPGGAGAYASSALGMVLRWLLIGYFPIHLLPSTACSHTLFS
jgi:hypothetical protein